MSTTPSRPPGARPLRRSDRYAMINYLGRKERAARMLWDEHRARGSLSALVRNAALTFQVKVEEGTEADLPAVGAAVSLLFRIRGLDFRVEGAVQRAELTKSRLLISPDFMEWSVNGLRLAQTRYSHERAQLRVRCARSIPNRLDVLVLTEQEIYFLCWPGPKKLEDAMDQEAILEHSAAGAVRIGLSMRGLAPVFPGCSGQIVRATVSSGLDKVRAMLGRLEPVDDRRADVA